MPVINDQSLTYLSLKDPVFERIINQYGIPPNWKREQGFETLSRIILEQQVSLESAKAAYLKLSSIIDSFTPQSIIQLSTDQFRKATVSRQKGTYLKALSAAIIDKSLDLGELPTLSEEVCADRLITVKGIGQWTARVYMMFAIEFPDIYPPGDVALINTIKELWAVKSAAEALEHSTKWHPHRTTASYLLWHYYLSKRGRKHVP